jgi:UDP-3-O-[3-hydroxymyristoyl] glucosamine N-acyltransferase
MSAVIRAFAPAPLHPAPGVDPRAAVDASALLGPGVAIGAGAVIGPRARIGARTVVHPGAVVGPEVVVGDDCELHPGVVLYARVELGQRVVIHAGSVLGSDGFGFDPTPRGWEKVPQCGTVVVEDDVEIGANCAIDCARFGATRVGRGAKLDNLVQIGHNVVVGPHALLVAQVAVAGSSRIGSWAVLAGQSAVAGHLKIGDRARVAAKSGVGHDVAAGEDVGGTPAMPHRKWIRNQARFAQLDEMAAELRRLTKRVAELEAERAGSAGPGAGGAR